MYRGINHFYSLHLVCSFSEGVPFSRGTGTKSGEEGEKCNMSKYMYMYHFHSLTVETCSCSKVGRMLFFCVFFFFHKVKQCTLWLVPGWVTTTLCEHPCQILQYNGLVFLFTGIGGPKNKTIVRAPCVHSWPQWWGGGWISGSGTCGYCNGMLDHSWILSL